MALELDIRLEGERQIAKILDDIPAKANKLKRPFNETGDFILRQTDTAFTSKGSNIQEAWPPRSPAYEARATWPTLDRTGKMRGNFKKKATNKSLKIENPTKYFKYHQSNKPRSKIPRRAMLKLTTPVARFLVKEVQKEFADFLQKRVRTR